MKTALKCAVLAVCGGCAYICVELLWRGHSHWTMGVVGGLCFVLIGGVNEVFTWDMPLLEQGVIGAAAVTVVEFAAGCILNLWLGLGIWDYSNMPGNLLGQVCPQFAAAWIPLAMLGVVVDDWLRYYIWGEERPRYTLF